MEITHIFLSILLLSLMTHFQRGTDTKRLFHPVITIRYDMLCYSIYIRTEVVSASYYPSLTVISCWQRW